MHNNVQKILNRLNEEWKLDFVSVTAGNCCNSCGEMMTPEDTQAWEKAKTFFVIKWFFTGMNYNGEFSKQKRLYAKYNLGDSVSMSKVCEDLRRELEDIYLIEEPQNFTYCLELIKI